MTLKEMYRDGVKKSRWVVYSSVNLNPQSNTRDKSWKAPGGEKIEMKAENVISDL